MVQRAFLSVSKEYHISYVIVLSRPNESALSGDQLNTVFPAEIEGVPPRFAISKRNDFLLKNADIVVCYAHNKFSNSYKLVEKAKRKGIRVINF